MKKSFVFILAVLMLFTLVPVFASAEAVSGEGKPADIADPNTIPPKKPALLWDKNKTSFTEYDCPGYDFNENADGSIHLKKIGEEEAWLTWTIRSELSFDASDFPFVCILSKVVDSSASGVLYGAYYCAGDNYSFADRYWDRTNYDTDMGGGWTMTILDGVAYKWRDERINGLKFRFSPSELNIAWIGCFRSEKEGMAYAVETLKEKGVDATMPIETTRKMCILTAPIGYDATQPPATDTQAAEKSGCKGSVAMIALIPAMAAAYVFTKKKHD